MVVIVKEVAVTVDCDEIVEINVEFGDGNFSTRYVVVVVTSDHHLWAIRR